MFLAANANLNFSLSKSSWQTGLDLGLKVMLVQGFYLDFSWSVVDFQDAVLVPTEMSIPENAQQVNIGVSGIYKSQDLGYQSWFVGLSFNF